MKIKKIIIKNFRAFDTVEIDFADFNCIIGKNDCGKSTVFAALDWFFNDKGFEDRLDVNVNTVDNFEVDNYEVSVEIEFSDTIDGNPLKIAKKITIERNLKNITGTPVLEYYFNGKKYGSEEWSKFLKYDKPFNLPKFELFTPLTPIKVYLNKFLNLKNVTYDDDIETAVDEISHEVYRETGKIELNSVYCDFFPDLNMPLFTSEGSTRIPLQNRGDGFQQIIKNAVFRLLASKSIFKENVANSLEAESKEKLFGIKQNSQPISLIFAFEEPETHLHPSAQLEMFNTIKSLSTKYQVLMTTHSPYIVKALKENKANIVVLERNADEHKTTVKKLEECVLPYLSMNEINYIAFDEPSIEYHIELYGYIQQKQKLSTTNVDGWLYKHGVTNDSVFYPIDSKSGQLAFNNKTKESEPKNFTLPYCVRNQIDHPHEKNKKYSDRDVIQQSIEIMRKVITENSDILPSRR